MMLQPETLTVLSGEEARFTCTTNRPEWGAMVWQLSGKTVLTISQLYGPTPSTNPNITAEKVSQGEGWSLILKNTQRHHEGMVTCDLQEVTKRMAHLYVQEKGRVRILGQSRMALKEQSVEFECQAAGWSPLPTLHWKLNNRQVSSTDYNLSSEQTGQGQFSISSNLSVKASSSCDVHCLVCVSAMTEPLSSTVRLTRCWRIATAALPWRYWALSLPCCLSPCSASPLSSASDEGDEQRQGSGAAAGNNKTSEAQDASKTNVPEDFDIDMDDPETEKAAVAIQSQFRKFQKKKTEKS
ncbi:immunoglobulin superfamily member 5 isoform X2 [Periophthalmus magnuspinnatus]|uniref:immunoglobulin superfamily member 5 isoform X2 n=1 Tax=Periophthalmus magnuspinnatus TaxID=409849 RepID=UPI0024366CA8|nr:immunoglobulin superfamily member 5 isoform X2 [Periophthalmus magnuspinnatus]